MSREPSMTNYVVGNFLGKGGFGSVYQCYDSDNDIYFAIKKVPISVPVTDVENNEMKALENEIKIYSKLNYHRRIVRYYGTTRDDVEMIIFMELVSNGSLKDELKKSGPFTTVAVTKYSRQILEGLEFLHEHKIIHRDIKAANILRDFVDDIKLADFGISKSLQTISSGSKGFTGVGSPHWMAPEVIQGTRYDYRADVWSLGATILEMLTGKPPYHNLKGVNAIFTIGNGSPVDSYFPSNLDQKTKSFLQKMFVYNPSERADVKTLLESSFFQDS